MNTAYELSINDEVKSHFEKISQSSRQHNEHEVIAAVKKTLDKLNRQKVEKYVESHIETLKTMLDMLTDNEWNLDEKDRKHVLSAMQYFTHEDDIISDDIPVIGLLDDCIVIDIVAEKIKDEIEAFVDFRNVVKVHARDEKFTVEDWIEAKRQDLFSRMRHRRNRRRSNSRTRGTSFSVA